MIPVIYSSLTKKCKTHVPTKEDNYLSFAMSELYDDESVRATAFRNVFISTLMVTCSVTAYVTSLKFKMEM